MSGCIVNLFSWRRRGFMVTKEQIERYINFAVLEAGQECCDDYFKEISDWIRKMPINGEVDFRCSEGGKGGAL
jgi:hypothetical protein